MRERIAVALNDLGTDAVRTWQIVRPEDLATRCQRTWHSIASHNPDLEGGDSTACVVQFQVDERRFAYFVHLFQPAGRPDWSITMMSDGRSPNGNPNWGSGFLIAPGSWVVVGGLGMALAGGSIRATHEDGSVFEDREVDGCAIVFAPLVAPPSPQARFTLCRVDANGVEHDVTSAWIGDGRTPPQPRQP